MLSQVTDAMDAKIVMERFPIVASIRSQGPQVARRNAEDLRADLRVVFLRSCTVDVEEVQRLHVHASRDFERTR